MIEKIQVITAQNNLHFAGKPLWFVFSFSSVDGSKYQLNVEVQCEVDVRVLVWGNHPHGSVTLNYKDKVKLSLCLTN
jgi:hypothetical protein